MSHLYVEQIFLNKKDSQKSDENTSHVLIICYVQSSELTTPIYVSFNNIHVFIVCRFSIKIKLHQDVKLECCQKSKSIEVRIQKQMGPWNVKIIFFHSCLSVFGIYSSSWSTNEGIDLAQNVLIQSALIYKISGNCHLTISI